jgi:hypothetical protein
MATSHVTVTLFAAFNILNGSGTVTFSPTQDQGE